MKQLTLILSLITMISCAPRGSEDSDASKGSDSGAMKEVNAVIGGEGNGGNIDIEANNLVALEASRLTADANVGRGGNININTRKSSCAC